MRQSYSTPGTCQYEEKKQHIPFSSSPSKRPPPNTLSLHPLTYKSKYQLTLNSNANDNDTTSSANKASVALSSSIKPQNLSSPTAAIDYVLTILTSDIGSIIIGSIGLLIALYNRISTIDFDSSAISATYAESINIQSRNDLLAVFASGAVLLNGISKLDVTSVLAESVILNGYEVSEPLFVNQDEPTLQETFQGLDDEKAKGLKWAIEAVIEATPAKTAVILASVSNTQSQSSWIPLLMSGILPSSEVDRYVISESLSTPILDRFLKQDNAKESYLPTLQALPGKVEFTYLPDNAQEVLLLPIKIRRFEGGVRKETTYALALGSDTAKSFTPRDVAWCQVLARRLGDIMA